MEPGRSLLVGHSAEKYLAYSGHRGHFEWFFFVAWNQKLGAEAKIRRAHAYFAYIPLIYCQRKIASSEKLLHFLNMTASVQV